LGYPYEGLVPHLQSQPSELGAAYWGNLARFGLFPNGNGGVGPSPFGMNSQSNNLDQLGFSSVQGMVCLSYCIACPRDKIGIIILRRIVVSLWPHD